MEMHSVGRKNWEQEVRNLDPHPKRHWHAAIDALRARSFASLRMTQGEEKYRFRLRGRFDRLSGWLGLLGRGRVLGRLLFGGLLLLVRRLGGGLRILFW